MAMILASSERTRLRLTRPLDLDFVLGAECAPDNAPYVTQWTREQHRRAIEGMDMVHAIIESELEPAGYLILSGVNDPARSLQLLRLVVTEKGRGIGREALRLAKRVAFNQHRAHRLFLEVLSSNPRARELCESEGFVVEGTLRDCMLRDGAFMSITVLSVLESEYRIG